MAEDQPMGGVSKRSLLAPEVVQTSAMDCGPASLKCLLEGSGIPVSYGRLREACQTDVDGTSIDTLEDVACQLGLEAEQILLPADHLLLPEAEALPALVVVRLPNGFTHFVVVWRRHGPLVQLMDPASGRRWIGRERFLRDVYIHELPLPAADWYEWARSDGFLRPLGRRLADLGLGHAGKELSTEAVSSGEWRDLAALDAAARLCASMVRAGGLRRGGEARALLTSLFEASKSGTPGEGAAIPDTYWSARPSPERGTKDCSAEDAGQDNLEDSVEEREAGPEERVVLRGAVLVRVRGRSAVGEAGATERGERPESAGGSAASPGRERRGDQETEAEPETEPGAEAEAGPSRPQEPEPSGDASPLSPELAAALSEPPSRPGRDLLRLLRGDGLLSFTVLGGGLAIAAASVILEALVLRGAIDVGQQLGLVTQRLQAVGYFLVFAIALVLVEVPVAGALLRLGRRLETRLRLAFLEKIPRLMDRYFQSRPVSDMAERSHSLQRLREMPRLGGQLVRAALGLLVTTCAIAWIFPAGAPLALLAGVLAVALPLAFKPQLEELDLRVRTHSGALGRFYLDALLGLAAVRAHGAERSVGREHESLLVEWAGAGLRLLHWAVAFEGLQALAGLGLAASLLLYYAASVDEPAGALLVAYWALYLPTLGEEIALLARQYPIHRNLALRLLEPLGAPEAEAPGGGGDAVVAGAPRDATSPASNRVGVAIGFESVTVRAAGHTILQDIDLELAPGSHVAIVGRSGAGKSSLVGLLLGWHRAARGRVTVDAKTLDAASLDDLRKETVWVDPAVQLWNRSLLSNLSYGSRNGGSLAVGRALQEADLYAVVERLPDGLQTPLGEGGGLVSGGEGQRVRLGRGLMRRRARLVILDEPFRGLDRKKRRELLDSVRQIWQGATLLCITHDVGETQGFDRVLVIDGGRIVEMGSPEGLARKESSRYRALLHAEEAVREDVWSSRTWRRMVLDAGCLESDATKDERKDESQGPDDPSDATGGRSP